MSHDNLSYDVCEDKIVTGNDFACPCLHGGVLNLTWGMASVQSGLVIFS